MAEGARLESVYTLTGIGGSNPSLSASILTSFFKARLHVTLSDYPHGKSPACLEFSILITKSPTNSPRKIGQFNVRNTSDTEL